MLFKHKYKRSNWMRGLLEAEDMVKQGYSVQQLEDEFFNDVGDYWKASNEYIDYYENNLKNIENNQ